ncbi:MAG: hypothetical protein G01um101418_222 [Parcubacteria group bacterium Gr01-1014_18]|nr:MAG: hypothetical protein Greene041636_190 [Parcubacteria group bacterium Greene0416_36]TSC81382.1 MAG: hypothetical protein G01um101418_222 [Parcubacteria group bacterium Gr01-1014_18]TSC99432.1 MAG: hypothetical protein Greene101420_99 [Parcubacteria group bacterium Greene1014_20]TSD07649.1 MAG: hypothetical protein Greene07142_106 [Parcubacteria group bacterium Greene0714_2]
MLFFSVPIFFEKRALSSLLSFRFCCAYKQSNKILLFFISRFSISSELLFSSSIGPKATSRARTQTDIGQTFARTLTSSIDSSKIRRNMGIIKPCLVCLLPDVGKRELEINFSAKDGVLSGATIETAESADFFDFATIIIRIQGPVFLLESETTSDRLSLSIFCITSI